jgi:hypothetical protein
VANSKRRCSLQSCKIHFLRETGIVEGLKAWCCEDHKIAWAIAAGRKLRAVQVKKEKQESTRKKKEHYAKDLPHQKEITRIVFNNMIRLLDQGQPCISCGKTVCGQRFEAGHFKSVGSHPELRYDPRNVYLQGMGCNRATSSRKRNNLTVSKEYEVRLRAKMGDALVDWLNGPHPAKHYTCADLIEMRIEINAEIRRLSKGLPPSKDWRALPQAQQLAA